MCLAITFGLWLSAYSEQDVESGVYRVLNYGGVNGQLEASGTGFKVAEPGVVITNYHVIQGARRLSVVLGVGGGLSYVPMDILWHSRQQDIAILKARNPLLGAVLTLADIGEDELHKKDSVEAIGFPGAADDLAVYSTVNQVNDASFIDATVSTGTVQRQVPSMVRLTIQHSANVNSGNSGGPLLDSCQRVVGVNTLSKSAEIKVGDMVDAFSKRGVVNFQTPGSLESAVHIREVINALKDLHIAPSISSGRCRSGISPGEMWAIGIASAVSFAGFAMTGMSVVAGASGAFQRGTAAIAAENDDAFEDDPSETMVAEGEPVDFVELIPARGGAVYSFSAVGPSFEAHGLTIGRAGAGADIGINDTAVSRRHALVRRHPDGNLVISDLGSTNGTTVNGVAATSDQSCLLQDGTEILFGDSPFTVRISRRPAGAGRVGWLISGFDARGHVFQNEFSYDAGSAHSSGRQVLMRAGRADDNDLVLDDASVSRHHARFVLSASGTLCIEDLNSSNGTQVDGNAVGTKPFPVVSGQKLQFGGISASLSRTS